MAKRTPKKPTSPRTNRTKVDQDNRDLVKKSYRPVDESKLSPAERARLEEIRRNMK